MEHYLKRQVYDQMLDWKQQSGHSTLEVSGARQVGKTYIVNKFADEQYKHKIYVNLLELSGELFLELYDDLRTEMKKGLHCENPVFELIKRYRPDFEDTPDTVVIIDEIQESPAIYNRIREFTRMLESDFIITGSYLGRVLNKAFKFSAGDLDTIEVLTLNFEEFLTAMNQYDLYEKLDLYGDSDEEIHHKLRKLYQTYTTIGGYPAVVVEYMNSHSLPNCEKILLKIINLFIQESKRYFDDILDAAVYQNLL